jgi:hypothetical protein
LIAFAPWRWTLAVAWPAPMVFGFVATGVAAGLFDLGQPTEWRVHQLVRPDSRNYRHMGIRLYKWRGAVWLHRLRAARKTAVYRESRGTFCQSNS